MSYTIRRVAEPGSLSDDVVGIIRAMDGELFPGCEEPIVGRHWWLALCGGKPVGYAGMKLCDDGRSAFLCRAGVLRAHRGHGLQKRFIDARLREARRLGCVAAITYTAVGNCASVNSLVAKGFRLYQPEWAWAGREFLYFQYRVQESRKAA